MPSALNSARSFPHSLPRPPADDPLIGTTLLGRYRIQARLGQGGTSTVYRGVHVSLDRVVAIKLMRRELVNVQSTAARLLQEGKAACRIRHEHVADVTDFGVTHDGHMVLVMEYLEGETLDRLVDREGPLPWPRARAIALQICDAVNAAHRAGVIHRDLTLANCFRIARDGNRDYIKVIDFGIARALGGHAALPAAPRLTGRTEIFGTPEFMAPEQARSARLADARSDVYAVGVQLYALTTGKLPLQGRTPVDTLAMHLRDVPDAPSELVPWLAPEVDRVIARAMAKDPDARYQSMAELASALAAIPAFPDTLPPPPLWSARRNATTLSEATTEDDDGGGLELVTMAELPALSAEAEAEPDRALRKRRGGRLFLASLAVCTLASASYVAVISPALAREQADAAWNAIDTSLAQALGRMHDQPATTPPPEVALPATGLEPTAFAPMRPQTTIRIARPALPAIVNVNVIETTPPPPPPLQRKRAYRPAPKHRPVAAADSEVSRLGEASTVELPTTEARLDDAGPIAPVDVEQTARGAD